MRKRRSAACSTRALDWGDGDDSARRATIAQACSVILQGGSRRLADGIDLERALRTAQVAMGRRNCELTPALERLWRRLYVQTRAERENAILRFRDRDFSRGPYFAALIKGRLRAILRHAFFNLPLGHAVTFSLLPVLLVLEELLELDESDEIKDCTA